MRRRTISTILRIFLLFVAIVSFACAYILISRENKEISDYEATILKYTTQGQDHSAAQPQAGALSPSGSVDSNSENGNEQNTEQITSSTGNEAPDQPVPYTIGADFTALKEVNADVVGWISIPGLTINYPLVQGKDNS